MKLRVIKKWFEYNNYCTYYLPQVNPLPAQ